MDTTKSADSDNVASRIEATADRWRQISRLLRASSHEDWSSLSLTRAQLRILVRLQQDGPAAVGQLAAQLSVTLPSITATVDRLVQQGMVSREDDPGDRRKVINRVTPDGAALIDRLQEGKKARLISALGNLAPNDLEALHQSLIHLERALGELPPVSDEVTLPSKGASEHA
jgi:DNA-binding MarR family transcriptional regulator